MSWPTKLLAAATIAVTLQAGPVGACFIHAMGREGVDVTHPGELSIAVALNRAQNEGLLKPLPANPEARSGNLWLLGWKSRAHVQALATKGPSGHPISVLLTQSRTWIRLNDPEHGAVYHADPPEDGEAVVLLPDTGFAALLDGALSLEELRDSGLLRIYADSPQDALTEFEVELLASANASN